MKKRSLLNFIIISTFILIISHIHTNANSSNVSINPDTGGMIVSLETLHEIEKLNDDIVYLYTKLRNLDNTKTTDRQIIEQQISLKQQLMYNLGAENIESDFLEHLIELALESDPKNKTSEIMAKSWHPSDLISQFQSMYNMSGVSVSYAGKTQYHVIFTCINKDPYLHKVTTTNAYDSFSAGSAQAAAWLNDLIKIYADKLIGEGLGLLNPIFSWLPWEIVTSSKPSINTISSSENALITTLNTVSTQKFVYIYNTSTNDWEYCLSTNKVSVSASVTSAVAINGVSYNKSKDFGPYIINGEWDNAAVHANTAFIQGYDAKTCINKVNIYSKSKDTDIIIQNIHTPTFPTHMI